MKVTRNQRPMSLNINQTNNRSVYHVNLTGTEQIYFILTRAFSHATPEQVLNVLQKAEIQVTKENQRGEVNFRFIGRDSDGKPHTVGFVNYFDNDLDDDSDEAEQKAVIEDLSAAVAKLTVDSIVKPLDQEEANDVMENL